MKGVFCFVLVLAFAALATSLPWLKVDRPTGQQAPLQIAEDKVKSGLEPGGGMGGMFPGMGGGHFHILHFHTWPQGNLFVRSWWDGPVQFPQQPCPDEHGHHYVAGPQHAGHVSFMELLTPNYICTTSTDCRCAMSCSVSLELLLTKSSNCLFFVQI